MTLLVSQPKLSDRRDYLLHKTDQGILVVALILEIGLSDPNLLPVLLKDQDYMEDGTIASTSIMFTDLLCFNCTITLGYSFTAGFVYLHIPS